MKNIFKVSTVTILLVGFIFTGCKKDEFKNRSTLTKTASAVSLVGVPSAVIVREDTAGVVISITASLTTTQIVDIHIPISQISGDATEDADFKLSTHDLVFPAFTKGPLTFEVTVLDDDVAEGTEKFELQIGDDKTANVSITPVTMEVTIVNATNLDLNMSFDWSKDYLLHYASSTGEDTTIDALTLVDYDFFVFDSLGSLGDGSGNELGYTGGQQNGRGSGEALTLTVPADEGVFVVSAYLYTNLFYLIGYGPLLLSQGPLQITTTFDRKGALDPIDLVQDPNLAFTTDTPDAENDGIDNFIDLFKIRALPNMFIIYKLDGSTFATARRAHHTSANFHKYKSGVPFFKWR